jgi:hypothetical protein
VIGAGRVAACLLGLTGRIPAAVRRKGPVMDPALQELVEAGSPTDEVSVVVRLRDDAHVPVALRLVAQFGPIATARIQRLAVRQRFGSIPVTTRRTSWKSGTPATTFSGCG